jgi:four helix bundle protein
MANYRTLDVWLQSMQLVNEVYNLMKKYPKDEQYGLISQSRRAVVSIPANIAEGIGRNHRKETIQFFHIARGSAYETETLLEVALMVGILSTTDVVVANALIQKCLQLINGMIRFYEKENLK